MVLLLLPGGAVARERASVAEAAFSMRFVILLRHSCVPEAAKVTSKF